MRSCATAASNLASAIIWARIEINNVASIKSWRGQPNFLHYILKKIIMNILKKNWRDISTGPMTEEAIHALHLPPENFKMYVNTYEAGTSFPTKAGHAFVLYVLAGSCQTSLDGNELTLSAAEFITLEKGLYAFDVVGNEDLKLVKVFSLS